MNRFNTDHKQVCYKPVLYKQVFKLITCKLADVASEDDMYMYFAKRARCSSCSN